MLAIGSPPRRTSTHLPHSTAFSTSGNFRPSSDSSTSMTTFASLMSGLYARSEGPAIPRPRYSVSTLMFVFV